MADPGAITITGAAGEVRRVYQVAATVGPWKFEGTRHGGTLSGQLAGSVDPYVATQRPLTFVVLKNGKTWRWPILGALQVGSQSLTVTVGPMESV